MIGAGSLLAPFELPFMQHAAVEVTLLAPLAGMLGAQIVLRRLAFFTHGVGTATFPGLVLAGPAGIPATVAALGTGLGFALGLEGLGGVARLARDAATALLLVAALAIGVVLASDVFESSASVDQLLFGSLLAIGPDELRLTAVTLALATLASLAFRRRWIAAGFDPAVASSLGLRARWADTALLAIVALAAVSTLDAVGALLVSAVLVIPAATARLYATSVRRLELLAAAVALAEGFAGLLLAYELDVPPGAAIAVLGGAGFAVCALEVAARTRRGAASVGE